MEAFGWFNTGFICGNCHYAMDSSISKNTIPAEFRAKCGNSRCENFGKVFRVDRAYAITLIDITDQVLKEEMDSKVGM